MLNVIPGRESVNRPCRRLSSRDPVRRRLRRRADAPYRVLPVRAAVRLPRLKLRRLRRHALDCR